MYFSISFSSSSVHGQVPVDAKDKLEEIVTLYLQFNFNPLPSEGQGNDESVKVSSTNGQFAAVSGLRNKLEQSLLCVADNLLNCYSPDVSGSSAYTFVFSLSSVYHHHIDSESADPALYTVSVHPSRVSGALFQSAHWCSSRLHLHWMSDWGGGLPLTALH